MPLPFLKIDVAGLRELQAANLQMLWAVNPRGGLGKAVRDATGFLFRYAVTITHVVTGTLQASHKVNYGAGRLTTTFTGLTLRQEAVGHIEIDPRARNPVTGQKPRDYGPLEHEKGGSHAFYKRTVTEQGATALMIAHTVMMSALPRGGASGSFLSGGAGGTTLDLFDILGGPAEWQ